MSLAAGSPPPAAARPARAGTRRAARPPPRPCTTLTLAPTLDLSLALRLTLRLTLTLINPNLDPRPNPNPDPEPDPNQALPGPGPASYSPVTAHPPPPRLHATKKPHHLVASAVNVETDKRFHSNLASHSAPLRHREHVPHITAVQHARSQLQLRGDKTPKTCSYHDRTLTRRDLNARNAIECWRVMGERERERDPQRGLSRATYLLKVGRRQRGTRRRLETIEFCAAHGDLRGWSASIPLPCVDDGPRRMRD